jgi:hypothetical protein
MRLEADVLLAKVASAFLADGDGAVRTAMRRQEPYDHLTLFCHGALLVTL